MLKELSTLSTALSAIRILDDNMPIQTLAVFLTIAGHEGISVSDLAERCGLAGSSASRNVAALSPWHWMKRPGLGLVQTESDPMDLRRKTVTLTPKGRKLAEQLTAVIRHER